MPPFPFDVYTLALAAAAAGTCLSLPLWRAWCLKTGHVDDPGHRKIHAQPIPLAGGLAVLTGLAMPLVLGAVLWWSGWLGEPGSGGVLPGLADQTRHLFAYGYDRRLPQVAALLAGALGMVTLGWLDDRRDLKPRHKFAGQFLIALLVAASGVRLTVFIPHPIASYALTILWILTVTNASNFMDNMNGLCAGLGLIGAWGFAWSGAVQGQFLAAAIAFATTGALLGFLPYNYPRASVFLGDAGSHLVGYLLAVLAILPHFYSRQTPEPWALLKPLLILAVLLGDLVWVVGIRWRLGKPFYVGDTNHLSHRLVRHGLHPARAVALIWLLAAASLGLAFLL